jgi:hypothetical protein
LGRRPFAPAPRWRDSDYSQPLGARKRWDLIICDFSITHFSGVQALAHVRRRRFDVASMGASELGAAFRNSNRRAPVHDKGYSDGARERTRTSTTLRSLAPEASASASSATRARVLWVKPQPSRGYRSNEAFSLCPALPALSTKGPSRLRRGPWGSARTAKRRENRGKVTGDLRLTTRRNPAKHEVSVQKKPVFLSANRACGRLSCIHWPYGKQLKFKCLVLYSPLESGLPPSWHLEKRPLRFQGRSPWKP